MKQIINLTVHKATAEQLGAGVVDLPDELREQLIRLITFDELPSENHMVATAHDVGCMVALVAMITGVKSAMIGGAPFFDHHLRYALGIYGITPVYAFSKRVSEVVVGEDGSVTKTTVFKHIGFV